MSEKKKSTPNADAWSLPGVLSYFDSSRSTTADIYPSEWRFLEDLLQEGMSILDIGCAQGGLASVVAEHIKSFSYTGLDISEDMIFRAKQRHPNHTFFKIDEGQFDIEVSASYDVVVVLGILHLHEKWRETLRTAWGLAGGTLLFDLRDWSGQTIEDISTSYMKMDFALDDDIYSQSRVPYIILNDAAARTTIENICIGASDIKEYGYPHKVTAAAVTPISEVNVRTWCINR